MWSLILFVWCLYSMCIVFGLIVFAGKRLITFQVGVSLWAPVTSFARLIHKMATVSITSKCESVSFGLQSNCGGRGCGLWNGKHFGVRHVDGSFVFHVYISHVTIYLRTTHMDQWQVCRSNSMLDDQDHNSVRGNRFWSNISTLCMMTHKTWKLFVAGCLIANYSSQAAVSFRNGFLVWNDDFVLWIDLTKQKAKALPFLTTVNSAIRFCTARVSII